MNAYTINPQIFNDEIFDNKKELREALLYYIPDSNWENSPQGKIIKNFIIGYTKKVQNFVTTFQNYEDVLQNGWVGILEGRSKVRLLNIPDKEKAAMIGGYALTGARDFVLSGAIFTPQEIKRLSDKSQRMAQNASMVLSIDTPLGDSDDTIKETIASEGTEAVDGVDELVLECFQNKLGTSTFLMDAEEQVKKHATAWQYTCFRSLYIEGKKQDEFAEELYPEYKSLSQKEKEKIKNRISKASRKAIEILKIAIKEGDILN